MLLARCASEVAPFIEAIRRLDCGIKTTFIALELDNLDYVRKDATIVNKSFENLDLLIHKPGIVAAKGANPKSHLVKNRKGHFLLTNLLMNTILAVESVAMILCLPSGGYLAVRLRTKNPQWFHVSPVSS
jgi:hypothetical protein